MALIQLITFFPDFNLLPLEVTRQPVYFYDELLHIPKTHFHPVSVFSFSDYFLCITILSEYFENI